LISHAVSSWPRKAATHATLILPAHCGDAGGASKPNIVTNYQYVAARVGGRRRGRDGVLKMSRCFVMAAQGGHPRNADLAGTGGLEHALSRSSNSVSRYPYVAARVGGRRRGRDGVLKMSRCFVMAAQGGHPRNADLAGTLR
jgi:hypothetical protein